MNNSNSKNEPKVNKLDISIIKDFIEVQKNKISLENAELELKKQHLQNQSDLAKQSLNIQEKLLDKAPKERRKDRNQLLLYSVIFISLILVFSIFCLLYNFEKFLTYFIGTLSHLGVLALGYYFGTQKKKSETDDSEIQDAEIVD